jgi:Fe-S cluster assembly protein SufD
VAAVLPTTEEEVWRYSRIGDLDLSAWSPPVSDGAGPAPASDLVAPGPVVTVVDGSVTVEGVPEAWTARGVVIAPASSLGSEAEAGLGAVAGQGRDVFAAYNDAFSADPVVISVPHGVRLDAPIVVRTHLAAPGRAAFGRLVVRLGEGAEAEVLAHATSADAAVLSVPLAELEVGRGARLRYVDLQELGPEAWQIGSLSARVDQEADLRVGLVALGGGSTRVRTDCRLAGRGANGDLLAAYFGESDQMLDFRTFQYHDAPDTTSNLLFKGAVGGRSRAVYTGLIRVDKAARGTNAFQTNRNVKLSDQAWAESVPNLEIETNDVHCSHASTVGPVDAEQRFYLESRGVPPRVADRLIVAGFFDEVIRQLPSGDQVAQAVRDRFNAKLDRVEEDLR